MTAKEKRLSDKDFIQWCEDCRADFIRRRVAKMHLRGRPKWKFKGPTYYEMYAKDKLAPSQVVDLYLLNCY